MAITRKRKPKDYERDYWTARIACEELHLSREKVAHAQKLLHQDGMVGDLTHWIQKIHPLDSSTRSTLLSRIEEVRKEDPPPAEITRGLEIHTRRELLRQMGIGHDAISQTLLFPTGTEDGVRALLQSLLRKGFFSKTEIRRIRTQSRVRFYRHSLREYLGVSLGEDSTDSLPYWARDGWELGDFDFVRELGRGAVGIVFEAHQKSLDRKVALKIVAPNAPDDERMGRFRREVEHLTRVQHDNVISIFKVGHIGSLYFLSMELIDGPPLSQIIADRSLSLSSMLEIVRDISRALDHAHCMGVLHRDVKPANILINSDGHPYLSDFGLAKAIGSDKSITQSDGPVGTPYYMAPERLTNDASPIGPAADVYGLGVILYEIATGQKPYTGDSIIQVLHAITHSDPTPPSHIVSDIDTNLASIILQAIARDPKDRYPSASALAHDLSCHLQGRPVQARPPSILLRTFGHARRNRWPLLATIASLGIFGLLVTRPFLHSPSTRHPQPLQPVAPTPAPSQPIHANSERVWFESHLAQGRKHLQEQDFSSALTAFDQAIRIEPNHPQGHLYRGRTLHAQGKPAEALQSIDRALDLEPNLVAALLAKAHCHLRLEEYEAAHSPLLEAVAIDDSSAEVHHLLSICAFRLGKPREAIQHLGRLIKLRPRSAQPLYLRARIHLHLGDLEAASEDLNRTLELQPNNAAAYFERARILAFRGQRKEAIQDYERSLLANPRHSRAADARNRIAALQRTLENR